MSARVIEKTLVGTALALAGVGFIFYLQDLLIGRSGWLQAIKQGMRSPSQKIAIGATWQFQQPSLRLSSL